MLFAYFEITIRKGRAGKMADGGSGGIGTLNERSLHSFLKEYFEPKEQNREVKIGRYIADILNADGVTEIQTRGFFNLKKKLAVFLKDYPVTVVYPVAQIKRLVWVDPVTGEASHPRLSPKQGTAREIFYELIHIKELLCNKNLRFKIVLLELYEYRFLDGWSRDRKKGSSRKDRVPVAILGQVELQDAGDYRNLLPPGLPAPFAVADFVRCARVSRTLAQRAVNVLCAVGAIARTGKKGNAYLYEKTEETKNQEQLP